MTFVTCAICAWFCRTALAACARWLSPVCLLSSCARLRTAPVLAARAGAGAGDSDSADDIQPSRFLAKFLTPWVTWFGTGFRTWQGTPGHPK